MQGRMYKLTTLVLIAVIFITANLAAIEVNTYSDKIENLLMQGELEQLSELLTQPSVSSKLADATINKISKVLNYRKNFSGKPLSFLVNFIEIKLTENNLFSAEFAGVPSHTVYEKFMNLASEEPLEAIKYYYIADYFRDLEIEKTLESLRENLSGAKQLINEQKYFLYRRNAGLRERAYIY